MSEAETVTLRERVRERLAGLARQHIKVDATGLAPAVVSHYIDGFDELADAILREFRLQPVAWGRVTEDGRLN